MIRRRAGEDPQSDLAPTFAKTGEEIAQEYELDKLVGEVEAFTDRKVTGVLLEWYKSEDLIQAAISNISAEIDRQQSRAEQYERESLCLVVDAPDNKREDTQTVEGVKKAFVPTTQKTEHMLRIWAGARERLRWELGDATFETWIAALVPTEACNGKVQLAAPEPFARNWVSANYYDHIRRALRAEGSNHKFEIVVRNDRETSTLAAHSSQLSRAGRLRASSESRANPHPFGKLQAFGEFLNGCSTQEAFEAAQEMATGEGDVTRLYIYGGNGSGKTHLLHATLLKARDRRRRTIYLNATDFGALRNRDVHNFSRQLDTIDLLVIDDLQHLCRRASDFSALLGIVDQCRHLGRPVIVAADRPPAELEVVNEVDYRRLADFKIVSLNKPDAETKARLLKTYLRSLTRGKEGFIVLDTLVEHLARMKKASPRDLFDVCKRLVTYAELTNKPVTAGLIDEATGRRRMPPEHEAAQDPRYRLDEAHQLDIRDIWSPERIRLSCQSNLAAPMYNRRGYSGSRVFDPVEHSLANTKFLDFIERLHRFRSVEETWQAYLQLVRPFGFTHGGLADMPLPGEDIQDTILCLSWPQGWSERYFSHNYIKDDPANLHLSRTNEPYTWSEMLRQPCYSERQRRIVSKASEYQLVSGLIVPVGRYGGGPAMVTIAGQHVELSPRERGLVHLSALYVHAQIRKLSGLKRVESSKKHLTAREREHLTLAAWGHTNWGISEILGISEGAASAMMMRIESKFGVATRSQAIVQAVVDEAEEDLALLG